MIFNHKYGNFSFYAIFKIFFTMSSISFESHTVLWQISAFRISSTAAGTLVLESLDNSSTNSKSVIESYFSLSMEFITLLVNLNGLAVDNNRLCSIPCFLSILRINSCCYCCMRIKHISRFLI